MIRVSAHALERFRERAVDLDEQAARDMLLRLTERGARAAETLGVACYTIRVDHLRVIVRHGVITTVLVSDGCGSGAGWRALGERPQP